MSKPMTFEEILRDNPQINLDQLDEARETLRQLREYGTQRREYDLVPPLGGKRITVLDDVHLNPRPFRARRSHSSR